MPSAEAAERALPGDSQTATANAICRRADVSPAVDADTWRPMALKVDANLDEQDLAAIGGGSSGGVASMTVFSRTEFTGWGDGTAIETPTGVRPLHDLIGDEDA